MDSEVTKVLIFTKMSIHLRIIKSTKSPFTFWVAYSIE